MTRTAGPAERYELALACARCNRVTPHLVTPAGGTSRTLCVVCGRSLEVDTLHFMEQYVGGFVRRLVRKPFEITTEFTRNPADFLASLPGRALTKPFRVAAELRTTLDIVSPRRRSRQGLRVLRRPSVPPRARPFRLLLSAPLLWAHTTREILEVAADLGYEGVELWAYQILEEGADPQALRDRARSLGLALTLHALSWDLNPTSRLAEIRAASVEALHRSVEMGAELGVALLAMHPGRTTGPYDDGEVYWPDLVRTVREVADHAAQYGIRVAVEHMEARQGEFLVTAEAANRLVREVDRPNVGIALDVAHIPWGEDEGAFVARLERIVHVHLSDADGARLHLPLGQGGRDLVGVLRALGDYDGFVVIEGFSLNPGIDLARWNKGRFEELWQEASHPDHAEVNR